MARPLRIDIRDGVYHVTSRGLERREIVRDDADRVKWEELLDAVATRCQWQVFAWALMGNHFHLFLRTPDANLSAGMHDLNSGYVSAFNRRHGRCGHLLQGRFKAIVVESGRHEWELSRYVHLNPVRAGLVRRPEQYRWGSCRHYFGAGGAPAWLAWEEVLSQHGRTLRAARRAYGESLAEGVASPPPSPFGGVVASSVLGSQGFVERVRAWLGKRLPDRELPTVRALRRTGTLGAIEAAVCEAFGVSPAVLRERGRWHNDARSVAIYLSRKWSGESEAELGRRFGGVAGAAISRTVRAVALRLQKDKRLARRADQCEQALAKK